MNAYAMLSAEEALRAANERLAEFRLESHNRRLASVGGPSPLRRAVPAALASLRSALAVEPWTALVPPLANYPYRS